ncbi:Uncharacterized protein Adt_41776 [Abeliophyllum distichum]|uniref:Uncharacterized protein n=1 Tax=Abeliophyllum distichum TaxID=126358 RepID=A0ABD1PPW9_9LAMI
MGCSNSHKRWTAVKESYGIFNKSRVTFLTGELLRTRKGSMTIDQYLNTVKQLADNLEIAGKTITQYDLVTQVLAGLHEEYTHIVVQNNSRDSISWYGLQSVLMTYKSRLEHLSIVRNNLSSINLTHASVNYVQRPSLGNNRAVRTGNYGITANYGRSSNHRGRGKIRCRGAWFAETGASNHVTTDRENFNAANEYRR